MQTAELIRVALFVFAVLAVYGFAAWSLVLAARKKALSKPRKVVIALAGIGTLCVVYGFLVEPYWLETTHVAVSSKRLVKPLRIAHLSDIHCDEKPRLEESLPDKVAAEKPDLIVFTGDSANEKAGIPNLRRLLSRLAAIAPTFVVRGNWDVGGHKLGWQDDREIDARRDMFDGTGVRVLDGEAASLRSDVWVAGISVFRHDLIAPTLARVPKDACTVFLCHWPDEIEEVAQLGADLYLAGHTHGGQVALPFYGALVTFSRYGKRYEAGLYQVGETALYVNRGIGMDGLGAPRVRFCARPELAIIEVRPRK
ncbi:MAG: metallophosphoesterase [Planctomycetota bacterium]